MVAGKHPVICSWDCGWKMECDFKGWLTFPNPKPNTSLWRHGVSLKYRIVNINVFEFCEREHLDIGRGFTLSYIRKSIIGLKGNNIEW